MPLFYVALIVASIGFAESHLSATASNTTHFLPLSKPCEVGVVVLNDCNKCVCTTNHYFECILRPCNKTITNNTNNKKSCEPNILYIRNKTTCLCKEDGSWPHKACETAFNSFQNKSKTKCIPNTYVIVNCNVCKCGLDGTINSKRCTNYECKKTEENKSRRYINQNQVYGSCEPSNWYSLAPCQFCYCISENKLVCNTGNSYSKKLQLGSYNLSICGKELINDAINLIPDKNQSLRYGINKPTPKPDGIRLENDNHPHVELNREDNEHSNLQMEEVQDKNVKDTVEYYTDSEEDPVSQVLIGREGSSTKLPYEEDEENPISDSENDKSQPVDELVMDIGPTISTDAPVVTTKSSPPMLDEGYPQHFEWTDHLLKNGGIGSDTFNLGDVLKPYLPVVLDKVFQMALRKSMVSIDANSNCSPGATTVYKCNACFCLKNKKLLCTNNECK